MTETNALDILCYTRSPEPSPLGLASQLGWFLQEFHDEGIRVFSLQELDRPQHPQTRMQDYLTRSIRQGATLQATWARSRGGATRVIGVNRLPEYQAVISLPGSGIDTPQQLRGRRVGLPLYDSPVESRRGESLHGLLVALRLGGLTTSDIELHSVRMQKWRAESGGTPPPGPFAEYRPLMESLQRGEVDAIVVRGPRGLRAAHHAQAHEVLELRSHPDPEVRAFSAQPKPITVDEALLFERPDIVQRFLSRVVEVGHWATDHPAETQAYYTRESRCEVDWVAQAFGPALHLQQHTDLADAALQSLSAYKRFMLDWGLVQDDFDMALWIDPAPLSEVLRLRTAALPAV